MDFEKRLKELFIDLPEVRPTSQALSSAVQSGKLLYLTGQLPYSEGKLSFKGKLGLEILSDQGMLAARYALFHCLSVIQDTLGSLNKVKQVVQLSGWMATGGDFKDHDRVLDAASQLLTEIFGPMGKHTRIAIGVNTLPHGACLELALVVEVR
ncbi:MAG: hypothetical protein A3H42_05330 [Deltaproteobacteria bacterium RIFCSPLOWO2_02_FULL_46_8]|nr:MAG: hypothetical protein A3H42_05330 [Deltaproteobacteria bacterium RIFCSPLOWO2_02_FULL_46_8]